MPQMSFLKFPLSSIRRSIKDIDDSYRNPWDLLAELAQNSVDAIRKMQSYSSEEGRISITINSRDQSIVFEDNGCGIPADELPELLNLFSSGKSDDPNSVGEKGVGLKFVMFQSAYFEIVSSDGDTASRVTIRDARLWKKGNSEQELLLDYEPLSGIDHGTKITVSGIEIDSSDTEEQTTSLFKLSFDQLKFLLRNKTYLGFVSSLWETDYKPISISIDYTDYNGINHKDILKNEYALPTERLSTENIVDLDDFEKWLEEKDRSDADKRSKLQGKVLVTQGTYMHGGYRKVSYWACFLPTRRDWKTVNENMGLIPEGIDYDDDEKWRENNEYCLLSSGIYTSTKGMPTGISISHPNTGYAGYWSNYYMLFQDDALTFDIGRKSIHGRIQTIYKEKAKEIFNRMTGYITRYTSAVPVNPVEVFDKFEIREKVNQLVDLGSSKVVFAKNPSEQEASVSAIFFELVGNGTIDDIKPVYLGYRNKYDMYALYASPITKKDHFGFYEFKAHLRNLTKDFSDVRKVFDEMDYVICWDVNDTDVQQMKDFGIGCEEVVSGSLHPLDCPKSVTHMLSIPNCNPVYVIDLKRLV